MDFHKTEEEREACECCSNSFGTGKPTRPAIYIGAYFNATREQKKTMMAAAKKLTQENWEKSFTQEEIDNTAFYIDLNGNVSTKEKNGN